MRYFLSTHMGLALELTKSQAKKAFDFGLEHYGYERRKGDDFIIYGFFDVDRWIYDIKIVTA